MIGTIGLRRNPTSGTVGFPGFPPEGGGHRLQALEVEPIHAVRKQLGDELDQTAPPIPLALADALQPLRQRGKGGPDPF